MCSESTTSWWCRCAVQYWDVLNCMVEWELAKGPKIAQHYKWSRWMGSQANYKTQNRPSRSVSAHRDLQQVTERSHSLWSQQVKPWAIAQQLPLVYLFLFIFYFCFLIWAGYAWMVRLPSLQFYSLEPFTYLIVTHVKKCSCKFLL